MPWKYETPDGKVEVVVDPAFHGDLFALATSHPVWIVDTALNQANVDALSGVGSAMDLYEVSRCQVEDPSDRWDNLVQILGSLDHHYSIYDVVAHGLAPDELVKAALIEQGFRVTDRMSDQFVALRIPGVRERLIGRC